MEKPKDRTEAATARLQYTLDRACNFIHDGGSSYARRARRAAKAGVPKVTVLKGLDAITEAISDARDVIERAYGPKAAPEKRQSRVSLFG